MYQETPRQGSNVSLDCYVQ